MLLSLSPRQFNLLPASSYYTLDETLSGDDPFATQTISFAKGDSTQAKGTFQTSLGVNTDGQALTTLGTSLGNIQSSPAQSFSLSAFTFEADIAFTAFSTSGGVYTPNNQYIFDSGANGFILRWAGRNVYTANTVVGFHVDFPYAQAGSSALWYAYTPVIGTRVHVALTYDGKTLTLYINGVRVAAVDKVSPIATNKLSLFNYGGGGSYGIQAKIRNLRVTRACRYAGNFIYRP